jgi:hypothetical protein
MTRRTPGHEDGKMIAGSFLCRIGIIAFLHWYVPEPDLPLKRAIGYGIARVYAWTGWVIPLILFLFPIARTERDER